MKTFTQLFFVAIIFAGVAFIHKQQPKTAILILNQQEMEIIYNSVDDASLPGQVRKPILQKISVAYEAAFAVKQDSIAKPKRN